jgi:AFG3 family protein
MNHHHKVLNLKLNQVNCLLQLKRNLTILQRAPGAPSLETVLQEWRLFCEKPPKGFEKFFKPQGSKEATKSAKRSAKEVKDAPKQSQAPPPPKSAVGSQPSKPSSPSSKPYDQWSFGMFGNQSR